MLGTRVFDAVHLQATCRLGRATLLLVAPKARTAAECRRATRMRHCIPPATRACSVP